MAKVRNSANELSDSENCCKRYVKRIEGIKCPELNSIRNSCW